MKFIGDMQLKWERKKQYISQFGGRCIVCGSDDPKILQVRRAQSLDRVTYAQAVQSPDTCCVICNNDYWRKWWEAALLTNYTHAPSNKYDLSIQASDRVISEMLTAGEMPLHTVVTKLHTTLGLSTKVAYDRISEAVQLGWVKKTGTHNPHNEKMISLAPRGLIYEGF